MASLDYFTTGNFPMSALTPGPDGNLYSTAHNGGASGRGSIFRLSVPDAAGVPVHRSFQQHRDLCLERGGRADVQAQSISNLTLTDWANLGVPTIATNGTLSASDVLPPGPSQRFYRVILLP